MKTSKRRNNGKVTNFLKRFWKQTPTWTWLTSFKNSWLLKLFCDCVRVFMLTNTKDKMTILFITILYARVSSLADDNDNCDSLLWCPKVVFLSSCLEKLPALPHVSALLRSAPYNCNCSCHVLPLIMVVVSRLHLHLCQVSLQGWLI